MIHSLFLLVLSFLSLLAITFSSSDDPSSVVNCSSSSTCGGVSISYPFWRSDGPPSFPAVHCGYPGFMILCEEDKHPILQIGSGHYYSITGIDNASRTINLTDTEVLTGPDLSRCPRVRYNLTFTGDVASSLSYTGADVNLTFFFNCSVDDPWHDFPQHGIPCLGYEDKSSFVFRSDEVPPEIWGGTCEDVVVAPVLLDFLRGPPPPNFSDALNYRFQLAWTAGAPKGCEKCESSGGRCGFDPTTGCGCCFYPDGTRDDYCRTFSCLPALSFSLLSLFRFSPSGIESH